MARRNLSKNINYLMLVRALGLPEAYARGYLEYLWDSVYNTGETFIGNAEKLAAACMFEGQADIIASAMLKAGFVTFNERSGGFELETESVYYFLPDHLVRKLFFREQRRQNRHRRRARLRNADISDLTTAEWELILSLAKGRCAYCRRKCELTLDHMTPLSRGGDHTRSNVVPACRACNFSKGTKTPLEFFARKIWQ